MAFLPPISHWTFFFWAAPMLYRRWPMSLLPVKLTASTWGCWTRASPTLPPEPNSTFQTPAGMPASMKMSVMSLAVHGVGDAGFRTTELPQISAAAAFHTGIATGKFHGVTSATTPRGTRRG